MVAPSMTDSNEKKPRAKPRPRKPNISSARRKKDNGRNVEVAMRTFEENIREKRSNTGEKNPIIGEILYTFQDSSAPVSEDAKETSNVLKEFVNVCKVSVTARLVTDDDDMPDNTPVPEKRAPAKPRRKPSTSNNSNESKRVCPTLTEPQHAHVNSSIAVDPETKKHNLKLGETGRSQDKTVDVEAKVVNRPESTDTQLKVSKTHALLSKPEDTQLTNPKPQVKAPVTSPLRKTKLIISKVKEEKIHPEENSTKSSVKPKSNDSKVSKKSPPTKLPRTMIKKESSPDCSEKKCNSVTPSVTKKVCEDFHSNVVEKSADDIGSVKTQKSTEVLDPGDFDLLRAPPKKKRISYYSQRKQEYGLKYALQSGDTINKKEMTMHDLIFYNPKTNPMSNSQVPAKKSSSQINIKQEANDLLTSRLEEEAVDDVDEADSEMPVPQLKLSADGKIILDPKSLVVQTSAEKSLKALENSSVIEEDGSIINRFTKAKKKYHFWSPLETLRFYRALNTIGTDFSLMQTVFPDRTRHDLKRKFKKEERTNRELIDKALTATAEFDVNMLEEDIKRDAERAEIQKKAKEEEARKKKEEKEERKLHKKNKKQHRKPKRIQNLLDTDTGTFNKQGSASLRVKKAGKVKTCKKSIKQEHPDTSEEGIPDFDSLCLSDEDHILHADHTYSSKACKRPKIEESNDEFDCKPKFKPKSDKKLANNEIEISSTIRLASQDEFIGTNSGIDKSPTTIVSSENESIELSIENQTIGETTTSVQVVTEDNLVYKFVSIPDQGEIESSSKSAPLYGNKLIGINNESESETDARNDEKENENLNVNDTVIVNEYVIISDISGTGKKPLS